VQLHHVTLFVRDAEASLRFYRDGIGCVVLVDREFDGAWPVLLGVESTRLRALILGDADRPDAGQVELVTFAEPVPPGPAPSPPATGTVMLSFHVDLDAILPAVVALGATDVRRTTLSNGHAVVTVRDPDGIMVELIDTRRRAAETVNKPHTEVAR
jgi:catechol 2,3-dioxygenase-like lactoylglutathione lyase family enzyme